MFYQVYILYSESLDKYYKGQTNDLPGRLKRHNAGQEKATKTGVPWKLLWSISKEDRSSALILESKIKNLSRDKLLNFMMKYVEGVAGPDALKHISDQLEKSQHQGSGC
jgi:putative endonuclease